MKTNFFKETLLFDVLPQIIIVTVQEIVARMQEIIARLRNFIPVMENFVSWLQNSYQSMQSLCNNNSIFRILCCEAKYS